jgi:NitT/TauT family transport system substrate-binding protein
VLYATGDFLKKNPNTAQALATAIGWTLDWMRTASIEDIANKVPPEFAGGRPELYRTMLERNITSFQHDGTFSPEGANVTLEFLRKTDAELKDTKLDVSKAYDPSFAEKAKSMPRPQ